MHFPKDHKKRIQRRFNRASKGYNQVAALQREVADRLVARLDFIRIEPKWILDLGAGTGYAGQLLRTRFPKAKQVSLDIAFDMLKQIHVGWFKKNRRVCGDAEQLPFLADQFDLVVSNLMLQWCTQPETIWAEIRRILKPEGLLLYSTFGPDTLKELKAAWASVDHQPHVHPFIDMHDLGDQLLSAQLKHPVMDREDITLHYPDAHTLMYELKSLGASNLNTQRAKGLTGKNAFKQCMQHYEKLKTGHNTIPATFEIIYGHAWGCNQFTSGDTQFIPVSEISVKDKKQAAL